MFPSVRLLIKFGSSALPSSFSCIHISQPSPGYGSFSRWSSYALCMLNKPFVYIRYGHWQTVLNWGTITKHIFQYTMMRRSLKWIYYSSNCATWIPECSKMQYLYGNNRCSNGFTSLARKGITFMYYLLTIIYLTLEGSIMDDVRSTKTFL